jgi:hypothetical protein
MELATDSVLPKERKGFNGHLHYKLNEYEICILKANGNREDPKITFIN